MLARTGYSETTSEAATWRMYQFTLAHLKDDEGLTCEFSCTRALATRKNIRRREPLGPIFHETGGYSWPNTCPPPPHYSRESTICRWAWLQILSTWGPRRARADTRPSFGTVVITRKGTESYVYHQTALRKAIQRRNNNLSHFLWVYELNRDGFHAIYPR